MVAHAARAEPRVIGRYAIYAEIASGGMASVHFARLGGPSGFARTVAIKRAHPHLARDKDFANMFMDEARLAARIQHPNVVSMIDVLSSPDELVLVMEYVHGESLWKLTKSAKEKNVRIPAPIAASIMVDMLHGLHAAHEAKDERGVPLGIVHRDVSPQNILVGVDGVTRLVDFGIAKAAGRLHSTHDSSVKGKYAYMAPEQVRGEPVSRLTDTYAAAIVFWELLTGERLFVGKSQAETIHRSLVARVQPPSLFAPELGTKLDDIVRKALSREPARRYQTARDMALDIEAAMPAIRASEVGAWVERIGGEELAARAKVLADIERDDHEDARLTLHDAQPATSPNAVIEIEPRSAATIGPSTETPEPSRSQRTAILVGLLFGILALMVLTAFVALPRSEGSTVHAGGAGVTAEPIPPPRAAAPTSTAAQVNAASEVQPLPPSTAALPAKPPEPVAVVPTSSPQSTHSPAHPPGAPPRAKRASKAASCDPPYSIDSEGRQIFKPECM